MLRYGKHGNINLVMTVFSIVWIMCSCLIQKSSLLTVIEFFNFFFHVCNPRYPRVDFTLHFTSFSPLNLHPIYTQLFGWKKTYCDCNSLLTRTNLVKEKKKKMFPTSLTQLHAQLFCLKHLGIPVNASCCIHRCLNME